MSSPPLVEYFEGAPSARQLLRLLLSPGPALLVDTDRVRLPAEVVEEVLDAARGRDLVFQAAVNPALESGVRVTHLARPRQAIASLLGLDLVELSRRAGRRSWPAPAPTAPGTSVAGPTTATGLATGLRARLASTRRELDRRLRASLGEPAQAGPRLRSFLLVEAMERLPGFDFPGAIHVALTTHCNLKCVMCPYHSEVLRRDHTTDYFQRGLRMPPELLDRLIREAGPRGASLSFGQYDEPFVYKGFVDHAVEARRQGCRVSITTNGTLLDEEAARRLVQAGVDHISFSLDAASAETYRAIRGDDFEVPLGNLRRLVRLRDEARSPTRLRACLVLQERNRHEREAFGRLMREVGVDWVSFYVLSRLEHGVWVNERLNFELDLPGAGARHPCSQLWSQVAVYPDGNVALCCATTLYVGYREDVPYVGNLHQGDLAGIWRSSPYKKIRAEALAGVFQNSVCRDCQIWHNYDLRERRGPAGERVLENPYETLVELRA